MQSTDNQFTKQARMGNAPIFKLILEFSLPAIVGMLVQALYNVVDRIYIGHLPGEEGQHAIAALIVVNPIMTIFFAIIMLFAIGGAAGISINLGKKDYAKAEKIATNGVFFATLIVFVISAVSFIFTDEILVLFAASENTFEYAKIYLRYILLGETINCIGFCLNRFIGAQGFPKICMLTMCIGAVVNTVLDPILIFVFDMGVTGAAIATVIGQIASFSWVLSFFLRGKSSVRISFNLKLISFKVLYEIASLGIAACALQLGASLVMTVFSNQLLQYGGDMAQSAYGIATTYSSILFMPVFGLNQGLQPLIGYNYGAKLYKRVRKFLWEGVLCGFVICSVGYITILTVPQYVVTLISPGNAELMNMGVRALILCFAVLPIDGPQIIMSSYFQATGQPLKAMVLSLSRQILFLIPLVMILPHFLGLEGIFISNHIADTMAFSIAVVLTLADISKLNRKQRELLQGSQEDEL